jgi:hypothetical protein
MSLGEKNLSFYKYTLFSLLVNLYLLLLKASSKSYFPLIYNEILLFEFWLTKLFFNPNLLFSVIFLRISYIFSVSYPYRFFNLLSKGGELGYSIFSLGKTSFFWILDL